MDLYKELSSKTNYRDVFSVLRSKAREQPHRLNSNPVKKDLSLEWAIEAETEITKYLVRGIRRRKYFPEIGTANEVELDKKRTLYSLCWPDRIFDALIAKLLSAEIDPHLSSSLYSFRKGYNNHMAVRKFTDYVREHRSLGRPLYILKRDVSKYADTIDGSRVIEQLREIMGLQDEYIWTLLRKLLQPEYVHSVTKQRDTMVQGLPVGYAITCVGENLFLNELDKEVEAVEGGFYCRYCDDLLFAHPDYETALRVSDRMNTVISKLGQILQEDKQRNVLFADPSLKIDDAARFPTAFSFDYLGFNINARGEIFLSENKMVNLKKDLRRTARYAFLANRSTAANTSELIDAVVSSVSVYFKKSLCHPTFSLFLSSVTNEQELRKLDKWIAKVTLRYIFGTSHDRVFRRESYESLRQRGLPSLVHLRRLVMRQK